MIEFYILPHLLQSPAFRLLRPIDRYAIYYWFLRVNALRHEDLCNWRRKWGSSFMTFRVAVNAIHTTLFNRSSLCVSWAFCYQSRFVLRGAALPWKRIRQPVKSVNGTRTCSIVHAVELTKISIASRKNKEKSVRFVKWGMGRQNCRSYYRFTQTECKFW